LGPLSPSQSARCRIAPARLSRSLRDQILASRVPAFEHNRAGSCPPRRRCGGSRLGAPSAGAGGFCWNVRGGSHTGSMCRSIKTLRPPYTEDVTDEDVRAAALQYVRKISGFRAPASHNAEAFDRAVEEITRSTTALLDSLEIRGRRAG